jgi:hypothetical protein
VEAAVRIVERWLLGRLRHRVFYSLADVNAAITELLVDLNDARVLRRVGRTRRQLFEELDYPTLRPLPEAGLDYHVDIDKPYYSVPYRFAREQVEARITANTIEIFHRGERIAAHRRSSSTRQHRSICHPPIVALPTGRSSASAARRRRSDRMSHCCANGFSLIGRIPNRATGPAWALSGSSKRSTGNGSMQPAAGHWKSALEPNVSRTVPDGLSRKATKAAKSASNS